MDNKEFVQGDYTFYIRPMDPFQALDLLGDLQKTFLPAIGAALGDEVELSDTVLADLLSQQIDLKGAIAALSASINGINLTNMLQRILNGDYISYTKGGEKAKKLDKAALMQIYQGNLRDMFALAWAVLRVNYADFFTMLPIQSGLATDAEEK